MRGVAVLVVLTVVAAACAGGVQALQAGQAISVAGAAPRSDVVYSNLTTQTGYYFNSYPYTASQELADDLYMAAGGLLDGFSFTYESDPNDTAYPAPQEAVVSFYDLATFGAGATPIAAYTVSGLPGDGAWIVPVTVPAEYTLPQDIVMGVLMDVPKAGPITFYPPTIGNTLDGVWGGDPDNMWFTSGMFGLPDNTLNFGFEVSVLPEPTSLLLLGLAGLVLRRR